ncbi:uncharacterized protein Z519_02025 [Cladophialophora bantiana CBS 173.52]|uniref:Uncharacterized protein n=1 Tax=Cladophialophora bantiana (strain ATCC 10958 / CBS 173.52 / CDC B-1940 / NIH 8579) TaxID=1442370 RepID=A0A0D2IIP1_CLAB1|nr:uncharacterized protein Z519_02025 [Cladophialophora bantiana CBS 173.52]KIW96634.1 hypothetical protein Z519_02025 [Cladophialophora bantiana CBS 173.52]
MSERNPAPPSPPLPQHRRRSSFVDMFNPRTNSSPSSLSSSPPSPGVPSSPTVPQHRRGTSITALGLTTNPSNHTPFAAFGLQRRASVATSSMSSSPDFKNSFGDEPAVLEEDDPSRATVHPPSSPSFARRVSFGAQALRDVRLGGSPGAAGGGRRPSSSLFTLNEKFENAIPSRRATSGTAKTAGEGFNWSEALRDRSKRSPSFSSGNPFSQGATRPRSASISNPEPPKEISKPVEPPPARLMKKPDALGERMLRGDFMMD